MTIEQQFYESSVDFIGWFIEHYNIEDADDINCPYIKKMVIEYRKIYLDET
tara:strand:- start:11700 stop:11852 length:153 start_codon:yes stop_codon:yes gene_type:complete